MDSEVKWFMQLFLILLIIHKYDKYFFLSYMFNRKKLDPLEAYVPAVILTQLQIKDLGNSLFLLKYFLPMNLEK